jgi:hypothetical protein
MECSTVETKSGSPTNRIFQTILLISLALNAFFIWSDHYDVPNVNFFSHGLKDAYFIRKHTEGETFVIEHKGHRYTVKCQDTLTWLDGIYSSGRPMGDGCTYMSSMVGKSIAEGLMRNENGVLVYQPWEQDDTEQTADILTIINDEKAK